MSVSDTVTTLIQYVKLSKMWQLTIVWTPEHAANAMRQFSMDAVSTDAANTTAESLIQLDAD